MVCLLDALSASSLMEVSVESSLARQVSANSSLLGEVSSMAGVGSSLVGWLQQHLNGLQWPWYHLHELRCPGPSSTHQSLSFSSQELSPPQTFEAQYPTSHPYWHPLETPICFHCPAAWAEIQPLPRALACGNSGIWP